MQNPPPLPPSTPRQAVVARFAPEPYQPDGGFEVMGLLLLSVVVLTTAFAVGWLTSFIGQWFYLIVLFPIGMGFCVAFVGGFGVNLLKVRNVAVATLIGLLGGGVAVVSRHYFDYLRMLPDLPIMQAVAQVGPGQLPVDAKQKEELQELVRVRDALERADTFPGYMEFAARLGVSISGRGGNKGINIGYIGTWIYWGFELVVVALIVCAGMKMAAREPFCGSCQSWKKERIIGALVGQRESQIDALREGDLPRLLQPELAAGDTVLNIKATVCDNCASNSPVILKVEEVKEAKGKTTIAEVVWLSYPGEALDSLESVVAFRSGAISPPPPAARADR